MSSRTWEEKRHEVDRVHPVSVESMAIALHHSRAKGGAKVVLLGIANHDGDGGSWPTIATLARYANVSPRRAQEFVQQLKALGEIEIHVNEGGTARTRNGQRPNLYEFLISCPEDCSGDKNHTPRGKRTPVDKSVRSYPERGTRDSAGVRVSAPVPLRDLAPLPLRDLAPEPSLEPSEEPSGGSRRSLTSPGSYPQERSSPRNPVRCDDHQLIDVPPPCGACRRARLAHEQVAVHPPARQELHPGDACEHGYLADLCPHCPGGHLAYLEEVS
jgi:hypothetical protein